MRIIRVDRPPWFPQAACHGRGPSEWFPPDKKGTIAARTVCAGCEVRSECLAYALADDTLVGVWGGTSENERDRLRRRTA